MIPLAMQHFMLLQRNLIYPGITAGQEAAGARWAEERFGHRGSQRPDATAVLGATLRLHGDLQHARTQQFPFAAAA